jgi:hypothetical protein
MPTAATPPPGRGPYYVDPIPFAGSPAGLDNCFARAGSVAGHKR